MKKSLCLFSVLLLTTLLWFIGLPLDTWEKFSQSWPMRKELLYYTGMLAYVMMSVTVILSLRYRWTERLLSGLDKAYQFHKWAGISSGILLFTHWMLYQIPKSLSKAGWVTKPLKNDSKKAETLFLNNGLAKDLGEWVAYLALTLIAVALLRLIPYHWFRRVHKLFPVLFITVTLHSISLLPVSYWSTPGGMLLMLVAFVGTLASFQALLGKIGVGNRYHGTVSEIKTFSNNHLVITCQLKKTQMVHQPGQFAFVRFEGTKDPHPFSLISTGQDVNGVSFCIKPLGDDTRWMADNLRVGSRAEIEGPYGEFSFEDDSQKQIWVAAGVGIAPFLSQLEYRATIKNTTDLPNVHFYYCIRGDKPLQEYLSDLCLRAGVILHLLDRAHQNSLNIEEIFSHGANHTISLWYCGPEKLGKELETGWRTSGILKCHFYRESFNMR